MKKKFKIDYVLALFLLFIVIILSDLILNLYTNSNIVITHIFPDLNATSGWEQRGQWGDILSGHFSALAFFAVAYTIYLQQKDSKIQKSLNSFKMILELVKNTKDESIYLTSKTNVSLIEILTKTLDFIKEKNSLEIVEIYKKSFHDILLIESFIESLVILNNDLTDKQLDIIMIKIRLIESEYKLIALLYLWTDVSLRYIREDFYFDNLSYEESKTRKKLSNVVTEVLTEIKEDMNNDYIEFFNNEENLVKYNHRIDSILFGNSTEIS